MGERTHWWVRAGSEVVEDGAYSWQQPPQSAATIAGQIAFDWDSFTLFEEDEEVFVHPRDPCTRIDVLRSSRLVRVAVDDVVIAESSRSKMLLASGLPVRWYLPPEDVRTDLLEPSYTTGRCPYKGIAHYWSLGAHTGRGHQQQARRSPRASREPQDLPDVQRARARRRDSARAVRSTPPGAVAAVSRARS